jgi:hypothetical protein
MKPQKQNGNMGPGDTVDETLRVIANLPAPEGLADRVQVRLRKAPRSTRILFWPPAFAPGIMGYGHALRGAAAAAIVCVVVGGGWRIYSHVQPGPSARVILMPAPASPPRGFSTAGSMHTPDPRPVILHQIAPQPSQPGPKQANPEEKSRSTKPTTGRRKLAAPSSHKAGVNP